MPLGDTIAVEIRFRFQVQRSRLSHFPTHFCVFFYHFFKFWLSLRIHYRPHLKSRTVRMCTLVFPRRSVFSVLALGHTHRQVLPGIRDRFPISGLRLPLHARSLLRHLLSCFLTYIGFSLLSDHLT